MKNTPSSPKIGLLTCVFLVVAIMVGTGLYTSLGIQLMGISSGFAILVIWALGGLGALCGALSYAELAAQLPESGGEYYYLSKIYHPAVGTMAGIITQTAAFVAPISLASMAFGKYFEAIFPAVPPMFSSMVLVTVITAIHLVNHRCSSWFQDIVTGLKFLLIALILFLGFKYATGSPKIFLPSASGIKELFHPGSGVALIFCFYAYSGWNSTTYMAGDVASSQKTVGRSLIIGTLIVIAIYLLTNAVFLMSAPVEELRGVLDIGHVAAVHLLGQKGAYLMSSCIAIGLIAGVSGMIWVGPSVAQMMGKNLPTLRWLSPLSRTGIPLRAFLLQYVLVMILLSTASFKFVLICTQFPLIFCELLGVLGVIVLRSRHSKKKDANEVLKKSSFFQCPLYPLPQIVFSFISVTALVYAMLTNPLEGMIGVVIIAGSIAVYPVLHRKVYSSSK